MDKVYVVVRNEFYNAMEKLKLVDLNLFESETTLIE